MCDYSLHNVASRPAAVGDKLVSTRFRGTSTGGFSAVGEPEVAVCLRPGTEIAFEQEIERHHAFGGLLPRFQFGKLGQSTARFRQVNLQEPHAHHDALELPDGTMILVTDLREGQVATVLQLPVTPETAQGKETAETPAVDPARA
ncbi:MAG: hypothetical protein AB7O60_19900 [Variibacter sp.]